MSRWAAVKVVLVLVTAWCLADAPTSTSPSLVEATIDGVVRSPSLFSMTLALPPSMIATHELVVPRSMPMIFAIEWFLLGIAWLACLGGRLGQIGRASCRERVCQYV